MQSGRLSITDTYLVFYVKEKEAIHDRHPLGFLVLMIALIALKPFSVASAQNNTQYQPSVIVVQFDSTTQFIRKNGLTGLEVFDRLASEYKIYTIERVYPFLDHVTPTPAIRKNLFALRRTYYVRYNADIDPVTVSRSLSNVPEVVYAEPIPVNRIHTSNHMESLDPNDPEYGRQSELRLLRLPEAWAQIKSESGRPKVVIAIVDGGADWRHEDLHANVWTNEDEIPDNGIDDDQNGFIDDVHGIDLSDDDDTDNDPTRQPGSFGNVWHGTAVAGIASAVSDNQIGVAGASWNALLMHINAAHPVGIGIMYGYEGILYAAMNGADVINASWGGVVEENTKAQFLDQSIDLATDMGALIIASAGNKVSNNDHVRFYPARHPRVLSVGATEKDTKRRAGFSNYGKSVDIFAPGESIVTTGINHTYIRATGTSFATPLVAGIAALIKTKFSNITPDAIREKIRYSAENIDLENPDFQGQLGRGFVNALIAVQETDVPAIRLKQWLWEDDDGDQTIAPGDVVMIHALFVNHLADAGQSTVRLVGEEPYSFLEMRRGEIGIEGLAGGDSAEVTFEFRVMEDTPLNQRIRFYTQIRVGGVQDMADILSLRVNRSLEAIHQGLNTFYTATGGDQWYNYSNWDFSATPNEAELDQWYGISMREGWLYAMELSHNNLTQSIPADLSALSEVQVFDVSGNLLSGAIPTGIGRLSELRRLHLGGNRLSGTIPSELSNLHRLERLDLFENALSGQIPSSIGDLITLRTLNLEANFLSGSIPPELGNLSRLEFLGLRENSLSGMIPTEISHLSRLSNIDLAENNLSGSIPPEFGNLSELEWLILRENSLSGVIPMELGKLPKLSFLDLAHNSLTGSIPLEITNLYSLEILNLEANSLSGEVPPELGNLSGLRQLILSNNSLTASLPRSLMKLDSLQVFRFGGQELCAPRDLEFQRWLQSIPDVMGSTCDALGFAGNIENQDYPRAQPILPLVLPAVSNGVAPIRYSLTPALPAGLSFESSSRTLSGIPTVVTENPIEYTYTATDAGGKSGFLFFKISVHSPVSSEEESLPKQFMLTGNYPNPFRTTTRLTFDLPLPAHLYVEVTDMTGRRVLTIPESHVSAGWSQTIEVDAESLSAGLYLYRLIANSSVGRSVQSGCFVRIR